MGPLVLSMYLTETGDWPEAENRCANSLARAREADDLRCEAFCLGLMTDLDTRMGRVAEPAATCGVTGAVHPDR